MPRNHTVVQGECLSRIAARYGFPDYKTIYDDPANAAFKKARPNPNVIYPGDVLVIPDPKPKTLPLATGARHKIVIARPKTVLRLEVQVQEPHFYELVVAKDTFKGKIDGKSPIEHPVAVTSEQAHLDLWPARTGNEDAKEGLFSWDLKLGHLDPFDTISGVQARLANLGFYAGPVDGADNADLDLAVAAFESKMGLAATGDPTNATMQSKLHDVHDGA
jgi:N-acetylmuramoyl-L-alanine amidase